MMNCERKELLGIITKLVSLGFIDYIREQQAKEDDWSRDSYLSNWMYQNHIEEELNVNYACGESKGVIIPEYASWVIKFTIPTERRDMCYREYENYVLAEELGLSYYFAKMEFLTAIGGIAFYAQEMVDCDECVDHSISEKLARYYESIGQECEDEYSLLDEVENMSNVERIDLLYGDAKLCQFISDRHINDLHCGNFGLAGDHYVIIDYSGYGNFAWE